MVALCLQGFPPEKGKLGGLINEKCWSLKNSSVRRHLSPPQWELGRPAGWYWPSYRLWIQIAHGATLVGKAHLPLLLCVFCHHLPATRFSVPKPGPLGVTAGALRFGPYSTTQAGSKQDIHLPIFELQIIKTRGSSKIICPNSQMGKLSPRRLITIRVPYIYIMFGNYRMTRGLPLIA